MAPDGRAHLDAVARWLQDAAFADGIDAGLGTDNAWVIRRTSMKVERLPRFAEHLELRTWCAGIAASTAERRTTVAGDAGAAIEAAAIWVHIDPATRRPARFPPRFVAAYEESAAGRRASTKLRHPPEPPAGAARASWRFARADVDFADHVNNAVYWRVLEEHADGSLEDGALLEAEYRGGTAAGDAAVALAVGRIWVMDGEGAVAASLSVDRTAADRA